MPFLGAFAGWLPSGSEMLVLLVVGLLLFGRRLPEVGKQIGRTLIQLRQGVQKLRDEMELDEDIRDVQSTVRDVQDDIQKSADLPDEPLIAADPRAMLQDLTDEALSAPGPEEAAEIETPQESLAVRESRKQDEGGTAETTSS